jgi:hypothetical protein
MQTSFPHPGQKIRHAKIKKKKEFSLEKEKKLEECLAL